VLDAIYDKNKVLVFGKGFVPYFTDKVTKTPNVFFMGRPE